MADFEYNDHTYRLATLDAMTQLHIAKRIAPLIGAFQIGLAAEEGERDEALTKAVFGALGEIPDESVEYIVGKCLNGCLRLGGEKPVRIWNGGRLQFEDIGAAGMMKLTTETIKDQLSDFFTALR